MSELGQIAVDFLITLLVGLAWVGLEAIWGEYKKSE
nr:MAG TPA: hypothetical protein [Caudoviricetes sp.]